ncbi:Serine/threonine-protein kinase, active site [Sesbania bispinosa]|nr:Serine/threonine-protein kinase, active site [Sesbania bispinosa]
MAACQYCKFTHLFPYLDLTIIILALIIPQAVLLDFSFQQFHDKEDSLNLIGDVYYDKGALQLTQFKKDSAGRVTYYKQLHLWDKDSRKLTDFTSNFSFMINQPNKTQLGDGITFFLASPNFPLPVPPDGTGIGLVGRQQMQDPNYPNDHPFVAVEFDTFPNRFDPPYDHMRRGEEDDLDLTMDNDFEKGTGPKKFSYNELVRATHSFAKEQKLGEGGFGEVYKGFIRDLDDYVAVKRISRGSRQGVKEYVSEVKIISQLRHRNLVQLIGWCNKKNDLLLIYEFMSNGSLDSHLFGGKSLLTWGARYNIAGGLASALLYLHEEWEQCVIHRDIKSSNVMLDSNFNAKLGDFGLARLLDHDKGSQTTVLAGTMGYLAPESATRGKASRESDVYSFGIVTLEIACGRKPIEVKASEEQVLMVEWVWKLYGMGNLLEAADARLCGEFDEQEMERLMIVGLWCAHPDYTLRPTMRQAVQVLYFEALLPILPSNMPKPTYTIPSFTESAPSSSSSSSVYAFRLTQTEPSSSSSSQSNASAALLRTY